MTPTKSRLWIALRFVLFGLSGLAGVLVCSVLLVFIGWSPPFDFFGFALALLGLVVSTALMLYGAGRFHQPLYAIPILCIPVLAFFGLYAKRDGLGFVAIALGVAIFATTIIRDYYEREMPKDANTDEGE